MINWKIKYLKKQKPHQPLISFHRKWAIRSSGLDEHGTQNSSIFCTSIFSKLCRSFSCRQYSVQNYPLKVNKIPLQKLTLFFSSQTHQNFLKNEVWKSHPEIRIVNLFFRTYMNRRNPCLSHQASSKRINWERILKQFIHVNDWTYCWKSR